MNEPDVRALSAELLGAIAPEADLATVGDDEDLRDALDLDSMDFLNFVIALAARVKRAGKEFVGYQQELVMVEEEPGEQSPYERLLTDAIAGDQSLFTREDAIEAAWEVVDPVLKRHAQSHPYRRGSWGPSQADHLLAPGSTWHNPQHSEVSA